ncbi:MAG: type IX secretion system sortase PorU [Paludibacteraceae bacterium]|nr:type IX secretion system sortase PorU [Paludibacteraceae bacterium]
MNIRIIIISLLISLSCFLHAETLLKETVHLQWQSPLLWQAPQGSKYVLNFNNALYPDENNLPFFEKRIPVEKNTSYEVKIVSEQYAALTDSEKALMPDIDVTENVTFVSSMLTARNQNYLNIQVLPFVFKDGVVQKLVSFSLDVSQSVVPKKAAKSSRHTYAESSVLGSGKFVKIKIANTGIYKLTYEDLQSMGVSPANVRIFGFGGNVLDQNFLNPKYDDLPELAIHMEKGSDGVFNAGDYVLFYAYGVVKWTYDKTRGMYVHQQNPYSTHGYYFVSSDAGSGRKITEKVVEIPSSANVQTVDEFTDYQVYEKEAYSIGSTGKEFYGELFNEVTNYNFSFNFPNIVRQHPIKVRLDVAASSVSPSSVPASSFSLSLDNGQTRNLLVAKRTEGDNYEKAKAANAIYNFTANTDLLNFNLVYNKPNNTSIGYLNYLLVNVRRSLKIHGAAMRFQYPDNADSNDYNRFKITSPGANMQVWDITDHTKISKIQTERADGNLYFTDTASPLKTYLAIDPTQSQSFPKPEIVGNVANQNLHGMSQADMVIITHPRFLAQSERLAQAHREMDGLTVSVVSTEQVYNEFSSGAPDATAYRWMMKMLYDRALLSGVDADMPRYLLLFGRGTFDNRKLLSLSSENLVLTYQADNSLTQTLSYVTDDYFGFLDDNEGMQIPSHLLDIGIGRLPALTVQDADNMVDKTIEYMKNPKKGIWKNQLCFLADDGDLALHMKQADSIANVVGRKFPSYQVNKIFLDAYLQEISASGQSYPLARTQLHDLIHNGLFYLNYTGHAGTVGWTNEQILTVADVKSLTNKQLPLWVAATCDFLMFDDRVVSAGEHVVLNPYGGGIGIMSATRPVYASQNFTINKHFTENLFKKINGEHYRVGDVMAMAKNLVGTEINKLSYVYVGDPALKITFPTDYDIITTHINENSEFGTDTLRAMSEVSVKGMVAGEDGNIVSGFNGEIQVVVYDKMLRISTLDNEKEFMDADPVKYEERKFKFNDRSNKLFSGKAKVVDGEFNFTFMLPKDLKYNFGRGRINYYAFDNNTGEEAQGNFENFVVGGTNPDIMYETEGPEMELYLNNVSFVSGSKVNETPLFMAYLSDENGINRVGSGIGHDLLLTIDNDPRQAYVLNNYFESATNTFRQGMVKYMLPELIDGKHVLSFRAWDLLNNSTTKTIEFEVVKGLTPQIFSVTNYPNPVKTQTKIVVNHDRPETVLSTIVEIFDLAGRKIWSFEQSNADEVQWDLIAGDGRKVKAGIYLYRVTINTLNSDTYSKTSKMLIVEQ